MTFPKIPFLRIFSVCWSFGSLNLTQKWFKGTLGVKIFFRYKLCFLLLYLQSQYLNLYIKIIYSLNAQHFFLYIHMLLSLRLRPWSKLPYKPEPLFNIASWLCTLVHGQVYCECGAIIYKLYVVMYLYLNRNLCSTE